MKISVCSIVFVLFLIGSANAQTLEQQMQQQYNQDIAKMERYVTFDEYMSGIRGGQQRAAQNDTQLLAEEPKTKKKTKKAVEAIKE